MARYQITETASSVAIELTEVGEHQTELLAAFSECQQGSCSCPTDEYRKVATMDVESGADRIAIRLEAKPGSRFEATELETCLEHTVAKVADRP